MTLDDGPTHSSEPRMVRRFLSALVALALVGLSTALAVRSGGVTAAPSILQDLGKLPDFRLTDQDGVPRGLPDLAGKWWVADFIFTTCHSSCPVMTKNMNKLRRSVAASGSILMVSISVDPERDTPEQLKKYSKEKDLATAGWWFLTGSRDAVQRLALDGFHLGIQENPQNPAEPILHSRKFVLVDDRGHIRGYFDGMETAEVEALQAELERISGE